MGGRRTFASGCLVVRICRMYFRCAVPFISQCTIKSRHLKNSAEAEFFCVVWAGGVRAGTALLSRVARAGRCRASVCGRFEPAYLILFMATSYAAAVALTTKRSFTLPSSSFASPLTGRAPRERTTASASTRDCSLVFTFSTSAPFSSMATSLVDSRNFAPAFSSLGIASSRCWNQVPGATSFAISTKVSLLPMDASNSPVSSPVMPVPMTATFLPSIFTEPSRI